MYGEVRCGAVRERGEEQGVKIMSEKNSHEKMTMTVKKVMRISGKMKE